MPRAYYNEIDKHAAAWLRNLIAAGHLPAGDVDERSIEDVLPADLSGYGQCHFFAGIGGWAYALRLSGWPDDRPVWTGSCPCQPFSAAGKGAGFADERHLWPAWFHLIRECRPPVVFGEQVASRDGLGWLDLVQADLEGSGYASGAIDLCAAGVGAPHIRQRLFFVADCFGNGPQGRIHRGTDPQRGAFDGPAGRDGATRGHWAGADWVYCRDEKFRPVEPGAFPLAYGLPARVVRLRGYGNAIVPQVAATFVAAFLSTNRMRPAP